VRGIRNTGKEILLYSPRGLALRQIHAVVSCKRPDEPRGSSLIEKIKPGHVRATFQIEADLLRDARERSGLPAGTTRANLMRYALAVVAGHPDPRAVAYVPRGPKPRRDND
jgi:hypothetical protein